MSGKKKVDCQLVRASAVDLENDEQLLMEVSQSLKRLSLSEVKFPFKLNLMVFGDIIMVADVKASAVRFHSRNGKLLFWSLLFRKKSVPPRGIFSINDAEIGVIFEDGKINVLSVKCTDDTIVVMLVRTFEANTGFDKFFNGVKVMDKLVVCGRIQKRILCWSIVSLKDGHADEIHRICSGFNSYVATKDNMIYFSCFCTPYSHENGVYAYDIDNPSTHKFTYKHADLVLPRGITVDAKGFIFVCNMSQPCCIHQLTKEGELVTIYQEEIPEFPYDIFWDQQEETLYVTTRKRNQVIVYKPLYSVQEVEIPEQPKVIRNRDVPMSSEELEQFKQLQIALEAGEDGDCAANIVDAIMEQGSEILKRQVLLHLKRLLANKIASEEKQTSFRIWPGTDLSTGKITFVCIHQGEFKKKLQSFFHIDISYKKIGKRTQKEPLIDIKREDLKYTKLTEDDESLILSAIEMYGDTLFDQHINLLAIGGGPFLLHENKKEDCVEQKAAVILYCHGKGIKPYGEDTFPSLLPISGKNIPVDIREGYFTLTVGVEYQPILRMGISIGERGNQEYGTLGPFVQLGNDYGFITCAHVVGAVGTYVVQPSESKEDLGEEFTQEQLATNICGRVLRHELNPDFVYREHGVVRNVGVDAALVQLDGRRQIDPHRFPDIEEEVLLSMGFSSDAVLQYSDGSYGWPHDRTMRWAPVFKYGRTTEFTSGNVALRGAMVRMYERKFHYEDMARDPFMRGLYLINGSGRCPFALKGDSGAGVFIVGHDDEHFPLLRLIGIVMGKLKDNFDTYCFAMPIEHALSALDIAPDQLRYNI